MPTASDGFEEEEHVRDLAALCEGIRAACAQGEQRGLTLADIEPLATLAAQMAQDLLRATTSPDTPAASER